MVRQGFGSGPVRHSRKLIWVWHLLRLFSALVRLDCSHCVCIWLNKWKLGRWLSRWSTKAQSRGPCSTHVKDGCHNRSTTGAETGRSLELSPARVAERMGSVLSERWCFKNRMYSNLGKTPYACTNRFAHPRGHCIPHNIYSGHPTLNINKTEIWICGCYQHIKLIT